MSNNYTHLAFAFNATTSENAAKIRGRLNAIDAYAEVEQQDNVLLITSESADVEVLIKMLRHAMRTMPDIPSPQGFEWAFSADKHRIGDFGGGAVVVRREPGPIKSIDTAVWLKEELSHG